MALRNSGRPMLERNDGCCIAVGEGKEDKARQAAGEEKDEEEDPRRDQQECKVGLRRGLQNFS